MSKCINCGKELTSGDGIDHYGYCNKCYQECYLDCFKFPKQDVKKDIQEFINNCSFKECPNCKQKDQRIAELEKEKQTAVKEFADELIKTKALYEKENHKTKFCDNLENDIKLMLKERGIE